MFSLLKRRLTNLLASLLSNHYYLLFLTFFLLIIHVAKIPVKAITNITLNIIILSPVCGLVDVVSIVLLAIA